MLKENNIFNLLVEQRKSADELAEYLGLSITDTEEYILMKKFIPWQIAFLCSKFFNTTTERVLICQHTNI